MGWFLDTDNDGYFDTEVVENGSYIATRSGSVWVNHQKKNSDAPQAILNQIEGVAKSLGQRYYAVGSSDEGYKLGGATKKQAKAEELYASEETIGEGGVGTKSITADEIQTSTPREAAEIIFQRQYDDTLPKGYTEKEDFLTFLVGQMDSMPKQAGITGADWYSIQDEAKKTGTPIASGMGSSMREGIAETKGIEKDIYRIKEQKKGEFERNFSVFLDQLPDVT